MARKKKKPEVFGLPRMCGTPDAVAADACKWPHKLITWSILHRLPGVADLDFKGAADWAFKQISSVCDLGFDYKSNHKTANEIITVADLGGPGGVLAWQELPCGFRANQTVQMALDQGDRWDARLPPWGSSFIPLPLVILHEGLHAVGVPHRPPGPGGPAVMDPALNSQLTSLQPWDVAELVGRYGRPVTPAPAPPPSPTPGGLWVWIPGGRVANG